MLFGCAGFGRYDVGVEVRRQGRGSRQSGDTGRHRQEQRCRHGSDQYERGSSRA
jgi:hypothetical protein